MVFCGLVVWDWCDWRAALDIPVIAIDDDFRGVADEEEVPVYESHEDTAADDVAESSRDHALPDVVANSNVWMVQEDL